MPIYVIVAALAVGVSLPLLWSSLTIGRVPGGRVNRNLTAGLAHTGDVRGLVLSQGPAKRLLGPVVELLARHVRALSPGGLVSSVERRLVVSGTGWRLESLLLTKLFLGAVALVIGMTWAVRSPSVVSVAATLAAGAGGYLIPDLELHRRSQGRRLAIRNRLPDTLDQLTICVEAGLGLDAAMARVCKSGHGPLAHELVRMLQELRVGVPRGEALENLVVRTDVAELRQFVHAVTRAESYGVPIAKVLRAQAAEQREKRRHAAEVHAMKMPVKIVFPLVFCILPTLFIVIIGPAALNMMANFTA